MQKQDILETKISTDSFGDLIRNFFYFAGISTIGYGIYYHHTTKVNKTTNSVEIVPSTLSEEPISIDPITKDNGIQEEVDYNDSRLTHLTTRNKELKAKKRTLKKDIKNLTSNTQQLCEREQELQVSVLSLEQKNGDLLAQYNELKSQLNELHLTKDSISKDISTQTEIKAQLAITIDSLRTDEKAIAENVLILTAAREKLSQAIAKEEILHEQLTHNLSDISEKISISTTKCGAIEQEIADNIVILQDIKNTKKQSKQKKDELIQEIQELENSMMQLYHKVQELTISKSGLQQETDNINTQLSILNAKVATMQIEEGAISNDIVTNTQVRDKLAIEIDQLSAKTHESKEEIENINAVILPSLIAQKQQLDTAVEALEANRSQLHIDQQKITDETIRLRETQVQLSQEISEIKQEMEQLTVDKQQISGKVHELRNTVLTLQQSIDDGNSSLDKLKVTIIELEKEKHTLNEDIKTKTELRDSLAVEVNNLDQQKKARTTEVSSLDADRISLTAQKQQLSSEIATLTASQTQLDTNKQALNAEITRLSSNRDRILSDTTALDSQKRSLNTDVVRLTAEKVKLTTEIPTLTATKSQLNKENIQLNSTVSSARVEAQRLEASILRNTSENKRILQENSTLITQNQRITAQATTKLTATQQRVRNDRFNF